MAAHIQFNVPVEREVGVRNMLRKHVHMWSGQLGEINITEMRIGLVHEPKYVNSAPYLARPNMRELE